MAKVDKKILNGIIRRIVKAAHPDKIILFGSAAAGEMNRDSDLDFMVVKSGVHRRRLAQAIYSEMFGIGVPVDIVVATGEDIEKFRDVPGFVISLAQKNGVTVYEKEKSRSDVFDHKIR